MRVLLCLCACLCEYLCVWVRLCVCLCMCPCVCVVEYVCVCFVVYVPNHQQISRLNQRKFRWKPTLTPGLVYLEASFLKASIHIPSPPKNWSLIYQFSNALRIRGLFLAVYARVYLAFVFVIWLWWVGLIIVCECACACVRCVCLCAGHGVYPSIQINLLAVTCAYTTGVCTSVAGVSVHLFYARRREQRS